MIWSPLRFGMNPWEHKGVWTPEAWQVALTALAVLFTAGTLAVAIVAATIGLCQLADFRKSARDQSRPFLIIDFDLRAQFMNVEVRNIGRTPAADVEITFEPPLKSSTETFQEALDFAFASGNKISMIAPGRRLAWILGGALQSIAASTAQYTATLRYFEMLPADKKASRKHFTEQYVLSLAQFRGTAMNEPGIPALVAAVNSVATATKGRR